MAIPPVQPNTVFSAIIEGNLIGQQVMSCFHYQYLGDAAAPHADVVAALQQLVEAPGGLYATYLTATPENLTDLLIRYQRVAPVRYAQEVSIPAVRQGARGPSSSTNLAAVITRSGELAGRGNISNIHVPGIDTADMADGFITAGFQAVLTVLAEESLSVVAVGPPGSRLVPVAFKRSNPVTSPQMVTAYSQDTIRTMRRRTVRLGS